MRTAMALMLLSATVAFASYADDWLLVEFSKTPPACEQVDTNDRCWGTQSDIASFEMRAGETLILPASEVLPPAWVRLRHLWVYAPDATGDDALTITLDRTPLGARLQVSDGNNSYLQSVALNQWVQLEDRGRSQTLWTRVSGSDPR